MEKVLSVVRHIVSTLGGALVGAGLMEGADTQALIGVLVAAIAGVWGVVSKVKGNL